MDDSRETAEIIPSSLLQSDWNTSEMNDSSLKDGIIDQLYELLLEHFNAHAHRLGFPELALPALIQLKEFLKKCKVGNFTKQMKQIVDKVDENCKFITRRRRTSNISLADSKAVDHWEGNCLEEGTPLSKFYTTWRKLRDRELMHRIAAKDEVVDTELPEVKRPPKSAQKATDTEKKDFAALFDSDSDDNDTDLTERFLPPDEKRQLKIERSKRDKAVENNTQDDIYEDFDSDELEQLGRSGSEGDDSDVEYDDGKEDSEEDEEDYGDDDDDDDDDDSDEDDDDAEDAPEGEDIVKDFTMSSDEDDI